jgi:hypothetical protein
MIKAFGIYVPTVYTDTVGYVPTVCTDNGWTYIEYVYTKLIDGV